MLHADTQRATEVEVHLVAGTERTGFEKHSRGLAVRKDALLVALYAIGKDEGSQHGSGGGSLDSKMRCRIGGIHLELLDIACEVLPDLDSLPCGNAGLAHRVLEANAAALASLDNRRRQQLHRAFERESRRHESAGTVFDPKAAWIRLLRCGVGWPCETQEKSDGGDDGRNGDQVQLHFAPIVLHD